jgi:hypothetical protein
MIAVGSSYLPHGRVDASFICYEKSGEGLLRTFLWRQFRFQIYILGPKSLKDHRISRNPLAFQIDYHPSLPL